MYHAPLGFSTKASVLVSSAAVGYRQKKKKKEARPARCVCRSERALHGGPTPNTSMAQVVMALHGGPTPNTSVTSHPNDTAAGCGLWLLLTAWMLKSTHTATALFGQYIILLVAY